LERSVQLLDEANSDHVSVDQADAADAADVADEVDELGEDS
jgi:hypothetical protein